MSPRLAAFELLKTHPGYTAAFRRLKNREIQECVNFIEDNDHLDKNAFATVINMWNVDNPGRSKNASVQWSLVCAANSAL